MITGCGCLPFFVSMSLLSGLSGRPTPRLLTSLPRMGAVPAAGLPAGNGRA